LLAADYSQMELRILAALSGDAELEQVFRSGGDVHAATAAFLFEKDPDGVTSNDRRIAKMVNFGVLYGMSAFGLSDRTGLSRDEAAEFIDRYFGLYSSVRSYFDRVIAGAAEVGYVETILGRRRYFPELAERAQVDMATRRRAEREAINAPIQGSAADITKVAMVKLHRQLSDRNLGGRLMLQVHDELLLEVPEPELEEVALLTRDTMCHAIEMSVDLEVDLSAGPNWLELERLPS
jgi:DNA polymerase-1